LTNQFNHLANQFNYSEKVNTY